MNNNSISWQENLYFKLESSKICDLNRLLHLHCPSTTRIKQNSSTIVSSRKKEIYDLSMYFSRTLKEGGSIAQLVNLFYTSLNYIRWVDANNEVAFTEISINGYCKMLIERAYRNEIKKTTYSKIRSHLSSVLSAIDKSTTCINLTQSLPKNDGEPFEAYSRSDLKKLLPILRSLFNQTSKQFIENPDIHMSSHPTAHTMTFEYNGESHKLRSGITKMICAAAFLMAFYTYANTSSILQLKRPQKEKIENGEEWYSMPSFKRRSFKTITLEIGEHKLSIPKYSISFFNTLLEVSKIIDNSIDAQLLSIRNNNKIRKLQDYDLLTFNKLWLEPIFKLKDERNRQLRASISRFRKTGSNFTSHFQGEIEQGILLDNTPDVRRKHYTSGNNYENISMMQDVTLIRQEQAKNKKNITETKKVLGLEILTIEECQRLIIPIKTTPTGSRCSNPYGKLAEKFSKKIVLGRIDLGTKLACADLLKCFGCEHQVIVQSVDDIWCLLSFRTYIEESLYLHLDEEHFESNFNEVVSFINLNILQRIDKKILSQAERKLDNLGKHPLWKEV